MSDKRVGKHSVKSQIVNILYFLVQKGKLRILCRFTYNEKRNNLAPQLLLAKLIIIELGFFVE
jgi:hypothetical protein